MANIQTFQIKSRYLKLNIFVTVNIFLLVSFDIGFYCVIFTNIRATLLVFIVIIIYYYSYSSNVQCCNSFFNRIVLLWFEIWPRWFESRLMLTQYPGT